ncbi:hypothetical protein N9D38_11425 [Rubripirellula sp.]|nr:hypothetical protein [Rubripirellula sp.]
MNSNPSIEQTMIFKYEDSQFESENVIEGIYRGSIKTVAKALANGREVNRKHRQEARRLLRKARDCCLCGNKMEMPTHHKKFIGNSAYPIKEGRCCDSCNEKRVKPLRYSLHGLEDEFPSSEPYEVETVNGETVSVVGYVYDWGKTFLENETQDKRLFLKNRKKLKKRRRI